MQVSNTFLLVLMTGGSMIASSGAFAQGSPDAATDTGAIEEIVVTAQKKSESLQRVPLAVSAVSGDDLRASGAQNLEGLQSSVPNLNIGQNNGVARITIRGIGLDNNSPSAEGSIAFHVDGVFVQRSQAALAGLYDLERVEVLRGPQGTLYGRNATGGSINVITAKPTESFEGYLRGSFGNRDNIGFEGAVSGALGDAVRARLSFKTSDRDGYGRNIVTGTQIDDLKERSVRGQVQFLAGDRFDFLVSADYTRGDDRSGVYHYAGQTNAAVPLTGAALAGATATNPRDIASRFDPSAEREFWGVSGTARFSLSDSMTLKSITAYRKSQYFLRNSSLDPSSLSLFPVLQREDAKQFSQEVQFVGDTDKLDWIFGLYYFRESNDAIVGGPVSAALGGGPAPVYLAGYFGGTNLKTDAYAAFGQMTYNLNDQFAATVGLRYSSEKKEALDQVAFNFGALAPSTEAVSLADLSAPQASCGVDVPSVPGCQPSRRWNSLTPRFTLEYKPSESTLAYATFSKGFKSGTYNLGSVQGTPVDPEKIDSYEAGLKSTFADGRLRANLSGFYYDYTNLQVSKVVQTQLRLENAATATIKGIELELTAKPVKELKLDASLAYLDARFRSFVSADPTRPAGQPGVVDETGLPAFNLKGNRLPQSPKWSGRLAAEYSAELGGGELTLRSDITYSTRAYFTAFNLDNVSRRSMTQLGASIGYQFSDEKTRIAVTGRNLTDQTRFTNGFAATVFTGAPILGFLNEPRSVVFSLERQF